jgi:hypothetical protein
LRGGRFATRSPLLLDAAVFATEAAAPAALAARWSPRVELGKREV